MIHQRITKASTGLENAPVHKPDEMNKARATIDALRVRHQFASVRALAGAAGIPQPTLSRFMSGRTSSMEVANFQALARLFGVTLSELLGEVPLDQRSDVRELSKVYATLTTVQQEQLLRIARALQSDE